MIEETLEIPKVLEKILEMWDQARMLAERISRAEEIILCGSGSSYHSALFGKILMREALGTRIEAKTALEAMLHSPRKGTLAVVISVSGGKDAIKIARKLKEKGASVLGITNTEDSPLAKESEEHYFIPSGVSKGFINTKEHISQCFFLAMTARELGVDIGGFEDVPRDLEEAFRRNDDTLGKLAEKLAGRDHHVFLGAIYSMPAAEQSALKLREVCYTIKHSEALSFDELPHGRFFPLCDEQTIFYSMHLDYPICESVLELLKTLSDPMIIGFGEKTGYEDYLIEFDLPDKRLYHILATPLSYVLTYKIAMKLGLDPDNPRYVREVKEFFSRTVLV